MLLSLENLGDDDISLGPHLEGKTCDRFRLKTIRPITGTQCTPFLTQDSMTAKVPSSR